MAKMIRAGLVSTASALAFLVPAASGAQQDQGVAETTGTDAVIVVEFRASDLQIDGGPVNAVLDLAHEPQLADLDFSAIGPENDAGGDARHYDVDGALVFPSLDSFETWRETRMEDYFAPIGGLSRIATSMRVFRPDLIAQAGEGMESGLEDVTVEYSNSGNDAAGDADIDAVTVICPGDHADCKPSN